MANILNFPKIGWITHHGYDVQHEKVFRVAEWFETETIEVTIGTAVGMPRPGMPESALAWFIADGWSIDKKLKSGSCNRWTKNFKVYAYSTWTTYRLVRRRLQSERVMQDMISSFTKAYNEGRIINNERYQEIVALYGLMHNSTEDALLDFGDNLPDLEALVDYIIGELKAGIEGFRERIEGALDGYGQSRIDEINRRFDAELAKARQNLIERGLFNNTIWPTTSSGIEREREIALNDLKDKLSDKIIRTEELLIRIRSQILREILAAFQALLNLKADQGLRLIGARNSVFKWMLDFMERRDDQYPDLANLMTVASSLGYAQSGTVSPGAKL
jgi:hypothetical protein